MHARLFIFSITFSLLTLSLARGSVPARKSPLGSKVTDDTVIYQQLSEIRVAPQGKPSFDSDIDHLSALERQYRERNLPALSKHPHLVRPVSRVSGQKYRPSRSKTAKN